MAAKHPEYEDVLARTREILGKNHSEQMRLHKLGLSEHVPTLINFASLMANHKGAGSPDVLPQIEKIIRGLSAHECSYALDTLAGGGLGLMIEAQLEVTTGKIKHWEYRCDSTGVIVNKIPFEGPEQQTPPDSSFRNVDESSIVTVADLLEPIERQG